MLSTSRRIWWLPGVLLAIALSLWWAYGLHRSARVEVSSASITAGPIVRRVVAAGTLQAITTVQVGAQVSGTIHSLEVDFNSIVRAGQVLARIDPAVFQASLDEASAVLAQAQAASMQAEADRQGSATAVE